MRVTPTSLPSFLSAGKHTSPLFIDQPANEKLLSVVPPLGTSGSSAAPTPHIFPYPLARVSNGAWVALDARGTSQPLRNKRIGGQVWAFTEKRGMWLRGSESSDWKDTQEF